ncbi:acyloxyacyl hydrolase [Algoriphagus pacificus]|uniref:Acyloxyacyl hydrolase n=1 Tax=Algoriphagus pacificus TaxID=2811234 RepID=A0ABS3CGE7_9BACT|nr:acyloxyacyl hydrolase [Algoriphagus pacificus]MBN7816173.1 acyloxyacyl hydrolase [Algoriphagus pacificus]
MPVPFKAVTLAVFSLVISFQAIGQSKFQKSLAITYENGPLLGNGKDWADQIRQTERYNGIDVRFEWRKVENTFYNYLYRYPSMGFGFSSLAHYSEQLGRPMGVYGFVEMPFSRKGIHQKFYLSYFGQIGLGFHVKPYDPEANPLNLFVGSNLNSYIHLGFKANYQLTDRVSLLGTIGLKHFSNGSTKKPNAGINYAPIGFGIKTKLGKIEQLPSERVAYPDLEKRGFWNLAVYLGMKNYEIGDPTYFRGGLGINYLWEASYKYRVGLGIDWYYGAGIKERWPDQKTDFFDANSFALVGSWEWKINKHLYAPVAFGVYFNQSEFNQEVSWFYERVGVRYRFDNNIFAGLQIKAHKAKADIFEFTFGYTIPGKIKYIRSKNQ